KHCRLHEHDTIHSDNHEIRRSCRDRVQSSVSAADDLRLRTPASLQRVLDQPGDVLFVFDDEHSMLLHVRAVTVQTGGFGGMSELLNLRYRCATAQVSLRVV